jgi:hypothetical protein
VVQPANVINVETFNQVQPEVNTDSDADYEVDANQRGTPDEILTDNDYSSEEADTAAESEQSDIETEIVYDDILNIDDEMYY